MKEHNNGAQSGNQFTIAWGVAVYNCESNLVFANVFKRAVKKKSAVKVEDKSNEFYQI